MRRPAALFAYSGITILAAFFMFVGSPTARASEIETVVEGPYLTLTSIGDSDAMESLTPGRPVLWQVGVHAHSPTVSQVRIGISATGSLAESSGLEIQIRSCTTRWLSNACPGVETLWLAPQFLSTAILPADSTGVHLLGTMVSTEQRWLLIQVTMPAELEPGATAEISIHSSGNGDDIETGQITSGSLAATGTSLWPSVGLAVFPIVFGLVLTTIVRRRSKESAS
jgi:signal peptidase